MNVGVIGMYNQQELLGFKNMVWSHVSGLHCGDHHCHWEALGRHGVWGSGGSALLDTLTKTKINWFKLPHGPASGLRGPSSSDAKTRP